MKGPGALHWIRPDDPPDAFPDPQRALHEPDGLLAVGGDLTPARLLAAYRRGIFPWYEAGQPILWWSPDPRAILVPDELRISTSLRKTLRSDRLRVTLDSAFAQVVSGYLTEVNSIENQMLVDLRADMAGLPSKHLFASLDDQQLKAEFDEALAIAMASSGSSLKADIGGQMVSLLTGEILTQVAVRLGVSAGVFGTGAASGWATLGIGVLVGIVVDQIIARVRQGTYLGLHQVNGVKCHHLAFRQEAIDWQIWIEDAERPVARKVVITFKEQPGHPQFTALIDKWNLSADAPESAFEFTPPANAKRIDLTPLDNR